MNISELIEFHKKGAESCEAYSGTPPDTRAVTKDICKRYQKKAAWRRDAVSFLENETNLQQRLTDAEKRAGELEGLLTEWRHGHHHTLKSCAILLQRTDAALNPAEGEGS